MASSNAVRTLEKKRADLKADLALLTMQRQRVAASLAHVEATLALLGAEKTPRPRTGAKHRWLFRRGELAQLCDEIERETDAEVSARYVAREIIVRRGWDASDRYLQTFIAKKLRKALKLRRRAAASSLSTGG